MHVYNNTLGGHDGDNSDEVEQEDEDHEEDDKEEEDEKEEREGEESDEEESEEDAIVKIKDQKVRLLLTRLNDLTVGCFFTSIKRRPRKAVATKKQRAATYHYSVSKSTFLLV